ncbi:MAG: TfoX/Sxy family protein [Marmoricola sp.]
MAYDQDLADRIRLILGAQADISEMKMFGGLAFLANGNMAIAASGQGGAMVRVDPAESDSLLSENVETMEMRGRLMPGWLRVKGPELENSLETWVERGTTYARSLPPKKKRT